MYYLGLLHTPNSLDCFEHDFVDSQCAKLVWQPVSCISQTPLGWSSVQ